MADKKIPAIGEYVRNIGTLVAIETIPPKPVPPETDYIFEEIDARCDLQFSNGDGVIKHIQTLNDFYGLESSVRNAIKEMKEYAKSHKITKDSDLEVVVVKVVTQYRKRPVGKEEFWEKIYADFQPLDNYKSRHDLPAPTETVVWSSKNG